MTAHPAARPMAEHTFTTFDGTELFYRHWPALEPETMHGAVVMFHRGHEHSGRMEHIVNELGLADFDFFAWDARGHGRSPGKRGDAPGIAASVRDVEAFIAHIGAEHGFQPEDIAVLAQSVGAVLAVTWVHDYAPRIRAMILGSPAFSVKLYVPFARPAIALWAKLRGNFFVNSYVKAKFLTHDPERIASFNADPLITRAISARILTGLYDDAERVVADAAAITTPTQLFISGADWVVRHWPQHEFYNRLTCPHNERHVLPGFYHDTFGEKKRELAFAPMRDFIRRMFAMPPYVPDLTDADRQGPSAQVYKWLESPLPLSSVKGLYFALVRHLLRLLGPLSEGVALGLKTGFNSGSTLDYVYRNRPAGVTAVGRFIDKQYLSGPGWSGIRVRKTHLEELLLLAAQRLRQEGTPVRIMDIAAGHGRYVFDALAAMSAQGVEWESALLRDYSPLNVEKGSRRVAESAFADKIGFVSGDAFDAESLAAVSPRPTLAIVSGLYELFPGNAPLRASLRGLADALPAGGYLLYTNQPWHPQLEFIARALTSHRDGQNWVMRCRSQAEMDQLVSRAGFVKITQRVDAAGIFTVSLARRQA